MTSSGNVAPLSSWARQPESQYRQIERCLQHPDRCRAEQRELRMESAPQERRCYRSLWRGQLSGSGALTYTILRSVLSKNEIASFCVNNGERHSFATIGDPERSPPTQVVCVDPWPIKAQAVLLEDHFCRNGLQVITGKGRYSKPGGKDPDYMKRLAKHAPSSELLGLWKQYVRQQYLRCRSGSQANRRRRCVVATGVLLE